MLSRIKRILRAIFGAWLRRIEDPELILKQNIRDLNEQVPVMNESIAMVRANVAMLETEKNRLESRRRRFEDLIRRALTAGRRDLALQYAGGLHEVVEYLKASSEQVDIARKALNHALEVKKIFLKEKERKTKEAILAIRAAERARWQRQVAQVLDTFEIGDISQTHSEMIERIEEQSIRNKAYLDVALDSSKHRVDPVTESAAAWEADEIVQRIEEEMREPE